MGDSARRVLGRNIAAVAAVMLLSMPAARSVESAGGVGQAPPREDARAARIAGGHDRTAAWMVAEYSGVQLRKRGDRATGAVAIEIEARGDVVSVSVSAGAVVVGRGTRRIAIDSAEALEAVQQLLGDSPAVFALRVMLSELEPISSLNAPETSLLSAAAFVASLVGDTGAPQRIADRFVEKHRGLLRQARMPSGSCWAAYSGETTAAWSDLQGCMDDADTRDFLRAAYERIACNAVWLLRTESAWFEYLNCLSPLSGVSK